MEFYYPQSTCTLATSDSSHLFIKSCSSNDFAIFINVRTKESFSFEFSSEDVSFRNNLGVSLVYIQSIIALPMSYGILVQSRIKYRRIVTNGFFSNLILWLCRNVIIIALLPNVS